MLDCNIVCVAVNTVCVPLFKDMMNATGTIGPIQTCNEKDVIFIYSMYGPMLGLESCQVQYYRTTVTTQPRVQPVIINKPASAPAAAAAAAAGARVKGVF
jgi:hypothetical protein